MLKRVLLAAVFVCLVVPLQGDVLWNTPTVGVTCDAYARDLGGFQVQVSDDPAFANVLIDDLVEEVIPAGQAPVATLYDYFVGLPDGTYYARARAFSLSLTPSEWSETLEITKDWTPPERPSGCRLFR